MPPLRFTGLVTASAALVGTLALAGPAQGAGRVLAQSGSGIEPLSARVAESVSPSWSTYWVSVRIDGGAGRFALVVPVPAGTAVDPSLDAWLEALDAATAPRIRPPKGILACGATTQASLEDTKVPHVGSLPPSQVAVLGSVAQVSAFAQKLSLDFSADDAAELSKHAGLSFVGVVYETSGGGATTETLRFALPAGVPELALGLLGSASAPEVVLWTIGEGRARVVGAEEIESGDLGVTWAVLQGASNYGARRQQVLSDKQGAAWLLEGSGSTPLYVWNVLPSGLGTIPPAVREYFDLAQAQGANVGATEGCLAPVWDSRAQGKLGARVSRACAPGLLAQVPGGPGACDEAPGPGEVAAAALRCGDADDLAFAFSGLVASDARVTRQANIVGSATPSVTPIVVENKPSVSLLVTADEADTTGCLLGTGGGGGFGGDGGGTGQPPYPGGSGGEVIVVDQPPQTSADVSCWGSSDSSSGDSCGGDSSNGSDQGDTCSGDGSNNSDSGDTCSGDSSSSNSDGDTCSGDSGSGSGGDSCSGSSDSGGDTCSGSSSSGSSDCSVASVRPRRVRVSALTLLLVALALPARRWSRRRRLAPPRR